MRNDYKAIALEGTIDDQHRLQIEAHLPDVSPGRVRVLVFVPLWDEPTDEEMLRDLACNPVFDFLKDPAEDLYSPTDGKPFHDEG
jgi:hypothetical protein